MYLSHTLYNYTNTTSSSLNEFQSRAGDGGPRIQSPGDSYDRPHESVVFQMMCLASTYSPTELDELHEDCAEGGAAWERAKQKYADYVVELAEMRS